MLAQAMETHQRREDQGRGWNGEEVGLGGQIGSGSGVGLPAAVHAPCQMCLCVLGLVPMISLVQGQVDPWRLLGHTLGQGVIWS